MARKVGTIKKKVLIIENFGADFFNSRINLAKFLITKGYEITALVPEDKYSLLISSQGIRVLNYKFNRNNKGIFQFIRLIVFFYRINQKEKFDIIHSFRFQPNFISTFAFFWSRSKLILHVTGLGIAFSKKGIKYLIFRLISHISFQLMFIRANMVIFQNYDDPKEFWFSFFWSRKITVIEGSGVSTIEFNPKSYSGKELRKKLKISSQEKVFIFISRLIWEKGLYELMEAFTELNKDNYKLVLLIVGWIDIDNPRPVSPEFIEKYNNNKSIQYLNKRNDIKELLGASDVFIYPSYYREGIPRSILEALAMARPIITTDMPGCRLTIDGNGIMIKPKSIKSIEMAVKKILSSDLKLMGQRSRNMALERFDNDVIFNEILKTYRKT